MRVLRRILFALSTLSVLLAAGGSAVQGAPDTSGETFADAVRVRTELGLPADVASVSAVLATPDGQSWDGPFTAAERAELARRDDVRRRLRPAMAVVKANPDQFGGLFFDQTVGDMLLVVRTLSETDPGLLEKVRSLLPPDATVEFREADTSFRDLVRLRDSLFAALPTEAETTAYADPVSGRVVITVSEASLDAATRVVAPVAEKLAAP